MLNYYYYFIMFMGFYEGFYWKVQCGVSDRNILGGRRRVGSDKTQARTKLAHGHPYMSTTALMCTKLSLLSDFYCIFKH